MSCSHNLQPNRQTSPRIAQWIPSHLRGRRLADDDRNQGEKSADPQMLNAAVQGSPWCWLGFLPNKQIVCLPRICARQAAASCKTFFDQICSGEVPLASGRKSINSSVQPEAYHHHLAIVLYNNNRHISPHINCGYAPDLTNTFAEAYIGDLGVGTLSAERYGVHYPMDHHF